jgi:hypothetical protein
MPIARHTAVNIRTRSWRARRVAETVRRCIPSNDGVFQSYGARADTDTTTSTFGCEPRRLVCAALVNSSVAGLSVVKTDGCVFNIERGSIAVGHRAAISKSTCAMHPAIQSTVSLTSVPTVPTARKVVSERSGVNDHRPSVSEDRTTSRCSTVTRIVRTQAGRAKSITAVTSRRSGEVKRGVGNCHIAEAIETSTSSITARVGSIAASA